MGKLGVWQSWGVGGVVREDGQQVGGCICSFNPELDCQAPGLIRKSKTAGGKKELSYWPAEWPQRQLLWTPFSSFVRWVPYPLVPSNGTSSRSCSDNSVTELVQSDWQGTWHSGTAHDPETVTDASYWVIFLTPHTTPCIFLSSPPGFLGSQ